jgi:hypothetical protein
MNGYMCSCVNFKGKSCITHQILITVKNVLNKCSVEKFNIHFMLHRHVLSLAIFKIFKHKRKKFTRLTLL